MLAAAHTSSCEKIHREIRCWRQRFQFGIIPWSHDVSRSLTTVLWWTSLDPAKMAPVLVAVSRPRKHWGRYFIHVEWWRWVLSAWKPLLGNIRQNKPLGSASRPLKFHSFHGLGQDKWLEQGDHMFQWSDQTRCSNYYLCRHAWLNCCELKACQSFQSCDF